MFKLDIKMRATALEKYQQENLFFPLIGAVLNNAQDGNIYADDSSSPSQVYVEHSFGFSQIFGESSPAFEQELEKYLLYNKSFNAEKVRLYGTCVPGFLKDDCYKDLRSYRQRFFYPNDARQKSEHVIKNASSSLSFNVGKLDSSIFFEERFGIATRFWRDVDEFNSKAYPVFVYHEGETAGICYAAAIFKDSAEIDVFVLPEFRDKGVGKVAVSYFINTALEHGINPLWDCFTNNVGSMALCNSLGFQPASSAYPFYTITK